MARGKRGRLATLNLERAERERKGRIAEERRDQEDLERGEVRLIEAGLEEERLLGAALEERSQPTGEIADRIEAQQPARDWRTKESEDTIEKHNRPRQALQDARTRIRVRLDAEAKARHEERVRSQVKAKERDLHEIEQEVRAEDKRHTEALAALRVRHRGKQSEIAALAPPPVAISNEEVDQQLRVELAEVGHKENQRQMEAV